MTDSTSSPPPAGWAVVPRNPARLVIRSQADRVTRGLRILTIGPTVAVVLSLAAVTLAARQPAPTAAVLVTLDAAAAATAAEQTVDATLNVSPQHTDTLRPLYPTGVSPPARPKDVVGAARVFTVQQARVSPDSWTVLVAARISTVDRVSALRCFTVTVTRRHTSYQAVGPPKQIPVEQASRQVNR